MAANVNLKKESTQVQKPEAAQSRYHYVGNAIAFTGITALGAFLGNIFFKDFPEFTLENLKRIKITDVTDQLKSGFTYAKDNVNLPTALGATIGALVAIRMLCFPKNENVEPEQKAPASIPANAIKDLSYYLNIDPTTLRTTEKIEGHKTTKTTTAKTLAGGTITSEEQFLNIGNKQYRMQKQIFIV